MTLDELTKAIAGARDVPQMNCPNCNAVHDDHDGFGVLYCEACKYCVHPSITCGRCDLCGLWFLDDEPAIDRAIEGAKK